MLKCCRFFLSIALVPLLASCQRRQPPNVIILLIDALRADHVHALGYARETTPTIDALAERGTLFTNAISSSNHTLASVPSIFTSSFPGVHGTSKLNRESMDSLSERFVTLAERLKEAGYSTAAWMPNPSLHRRYGMSQGFDYYDDRVMESAAVGKQGWQRWETAERINRGALAWLDRERPRKFFLYLHYRDVHAPYKPPPQYREMFWDREKARTQPEKLRPITPEERRKMTASYQLPDDHDALDFYVAMYDGEIRYTDDRVKDLLAKLEKRRLLDSTVVFISADHGEAFFEHGQSAHGQTTYQEEIHIPLLMIDFRTRAPGQRIDVPVQGVDIFPTILELIGAPPVAEHQGKSLLGTIREPTVEFAFSEGLDFTSVISGRWKLVHDRRAGRFELYDLVSDPGERKDLASAETERLAELRAELERFQERNENHPLRTVAEKNAVDSKTAEELKALGYIQ